jgi:hypothetical protein
LATTASFAQNKASAISKGDVDRRAQSHEQTVSPDQLPGPAADMRDAILSAARARDLVELKSVLELNEMRPELADSPVSDPIAFWKSTSRDGNGLEFLAALVQLLEGPAAVVPFGKDVENNRIFVWPSFADKRLDALGAEEAAALERLVPAEAAAAMKSEGRYRGWRLAIGADGTWHSVRRVP